jgi:hypothetical protein
MGFNGIMDRKKPLLFSTAASEWLTSKSELRPKTVTGYKQRLLPVTNAFGQRLITDVCVDDILSYRRAWLDPGVSNRTVKYRRKRIAGFFALVSLVVRRLFFFCTRLPWTVAFVLLKLELCGFAI